MSDVQLSRRWVWWHPDTDAEGFFQACCEVAARRRVVREACRLKVRREQNQLQRTDRVWYGFGSHFRTWCKVSWGWTHDGRQI